MERPDEKPPLLEFDRLIPDAVGIAMRAADPADVLRWMRERLLAYAAPRSPLHNNPNLARALAFALTRAVWNGLPLNSSGEKPAPMREPDAQDLCPCGSGITFNVCCHKLPDVPVLAPDALWPYVLANIGELDRDVLLQSNRVSRSALIEFAAHLLEGNRREEVIAALEPRLRTPERYNDEDTAILLDLLCDAYGTSETGKQRKLELLEWTTEKAPRSPLRAEAWQRLTSIYMDHGDPPRAWSAFHRAQEDNPQADELCVLEVELLVAEHQLDKAQEHAKLWLERLNRSGAPADDPRFAFLRRMSLDPLARSEPSAVLQEEAQPLRSWLSRVKSRELPDYVLATVDSDRRTNDEARLSKRRRAALTRTPRTFPAAAYLVSPAALQVLEKHWHTVFPLPKPFDLQDQLFGGSDAWTEDAQARWRAFLEAHSESFDSIDILDDLATAIGRHPRWRSREIENQLLAPVLERHEAIVDRACVHLGDAVLSWSRVENRSALRGLVRLLHRHVARNDLKSAEKLADKLLRLNPTDDHGVRGLIVQTRS